MATTPLPRSPKDIIDEIIEKCKDKKCIFRGESRKYNKKGETPVSSTLYRKLRKLGVKNPSVLSTEKNIVESAKQHFPTNTSNIEILTEIQHFGGTTALIDFTYNLHVALYFACVGDAEHDDGQLFIYDIKKLDEKTNIEYSENNKYEKTIFIKPNSKNPRVISQQSVFIHSPAGYLEKNSIYKIETILPSEKKYIKIYLDDYFGINQQTIYNDIHGLIHNLQHPSLDEIVHYKGLASHDEKEYKKAIYYYSKAIKINPQFAQAYHNRGLAKFSLGYKEKSILDYDKAIEISPQFAQAYNNLGAAKYALGRNEKAILDFDKAIEINSQYAKAYNNRGLAKSDLKRYEEAILDFNKAIEINPQLEQAYYNRGFAKFSLNKYEEAILDFDKAIEINPQFVLAYNGRGNTKSHWGKYAEGILDYDKAIEINPQFTLAYYNRGLAKFNSGDKKGAKQDWLQAKKLAKEQNINDTIEKTNKALQQFEN